MDEFIIVHTAAVCEITCLYVCMCIKQVLSLLVFYPIFPAVVQSHYWLSMSIASSPVGYERWQLFSCCLDYGHTRVLLCHLQLLKAEISENNRRYLGVLPDVSFQSIPCMFLALWTTCQIIHQYTSFLSRTVKTCITSSWCSVLFL